MRRPPARLPAVALLAVGLVVPAGVASAQPASAPPSGDLADGYVVYMENAGEEFNPKLRILAKDPDGTNKRVIETNGVDVAIYDPMVSPDGQYLTFNSGNEVYVMKIGKRKSLKRVDTFGDLPSEASWAPDSSEFVFTSLMPPFYDNRDVIIANPKGRFRQVTQTSADEDGAAWSPDGSKIAFTVRSTKGCLDGGTVRRFDDLYVSNPNGSGRQLVTGSLPYDWELQDWSSTGILANATYAGATGNPADACPVDGPVAHLVDPAGTSATALLGDLRVRALALSPDETGVLFTRGSGQDDSIWVANLDGTDQVRIAKNTFTADWAPHPAG